MNSNKVTSYYIIGSVASMGVSIICLVFSYKNSLRTKKLTETIEDLENKVDSIGKELCDVNIILSKHKRELLYLDRINRYKNYTDITVKYNDIEVESDTTSICGLIMDKESIVDSESEDFDIFVDC